MPLRKTPLVNGEYYHVYNRGVASLPTFSSKKDYERLLLCLFYYRFRNLPFKLSRLLQIPEEEREQVLVKLQNTNDKQVELIAFCFMPNHFHLLIQQITDGGISQFLKQITDSYTRYFNTKYDRAGPLFQGVFKAVHIETGEQLLHVSRYIHLNPLVSYVVRDQDFLSYPWSSLQDYLGDKYHVINQQIILSSFKSPQDYYNFVLDQADYGRELEKIKHLTLEK